MGLLAYFEPETRVVAANVLFLLNKIQKLKFYVISFISGSFKLKIALVAALVVVVLH